MTTYTASRITVQVPDFDLFRRNYEDAVPDLPAREVADLLERGAPWSEMAGLVDRSAPHGFLIYSRNDAYPLMHAAGNATRCVWYLMGNHILAERMFRHDPRTMLYAPLRTVISEDADARAWFSVEQPSAQFASLGDPAISGVGAELDHKLAALLHALDIDPPKSLLQN